MFEDLAEIVGIVILQTAQTAFNTISGIDASGQPAVRFRCETCITGGGLDKELEVETWHPVSANGAK